MIKDRTYRMSEPGRIDCRTTFLHHHAFLHVLQGGIVPNLVLEGQFVVPRSSVLVIAAGEELPNHQATSVHVNAKEGVRLETNGPLQHLGGHVTPRANLHKK